jgi:hypothetical protein
MTMDPITFSPVLADGSLLPSSLMVLLEAIEWLVKIFAVAVLYLFSVGVFCGLIYLIHFLFSLPMRRAEYARLFLDLVEGAIKRGQAVEEMILSLAQSRDRAVGLRFHLMAAYIESGLSFGEALEKVPRFLPPQIVAMLRAGEKLGDLKKVLPASREILRDRPVAVRSAMHYLILVILLFFPIFILVVMLMAIFVIPRFKEVAAAMNIELWREPCLFSAIPADWSVLKWQCCWPSWARWRFISADRNLPAGFNPAMCRWWIGSPGISRGNESGCNAPFPPCSPCCSMAACRKPKPCGLRAMPPPMKSAAAAPPASWLRSKTARNWMTRCALSTTRANFTGG